MEIFTMGGPSEYFQRLCVCVCVCLTVLYTLYSHYATHETLARDGKGGVMEIKRETSTIMYENLISEPNKGGRNPPTGLGAKP